MRMLITPEVVKIALVLLDPLGIAITPPFTMNIQVLRVVNERPLNSLSDPEASNR